MKKEELTTLEIILEMENKNKELLEKYNLFYLLEEDSNNDIDKLILFLAFVFELTDFINSKYLNEDKDDKDDIFMKTFYMGIFAFLQSLLKAIEKVHKNLSEKRIKRNEEEKSLYKKKIEDELKKIIERLERLENQEC